VIDVLQIKVGCSGFPVSRPRYFSSFDVVEIQSTFYRLPHPPTVARWRSEAPAGFEYVVKAWQAITHEPSSRTWRKSNVKIVGTKAKRYGSLKPTRENLDAWLLTVDVCHGLKAKTCLIQCPASFEPSRENVRNLTSFFQRIDREGLVIGWEPRGRWSEQPKLIAKLCKELDLIHVVDLLTVSPALVGHAGYVRLHGLGKREQNYRYKYSDDELKTLSQKLSNLSSQGMERIYLFFNNINMLDDALRFKNLLEIRKLL
jgi:uncharacterized protein YecE (DUF72 family)